MTDTPLITIGIPCFNAQDNILRAIKSARAQSWNNIEIIVVDDQSTDNTVSLIENFIAQHEINNLRLIQNPSNLGPGGTRDVIVQNARGDFIAFFDDDDESHPDRLTQQYERIVGYEQKTRETLIACYASGERRYPNGYILNLEAIGSKGNPPYGHGVADRILFFASPKPPQKDWFFGYGTPTCSLMARTKTYKTVGSFDPQLRRVEDLDFAVRLALKGGHFIGCPEKLFVQHATTGQDKTADKNLHAELHLVEKHKSYLQKHGYYMYAKTWPKIRHAHFTRNYVLMAMYIFILLLRYPMKTVKHILTTGPARLRHEHKMKDSP